MLLKVSAEANCLEKFEDWWKESCRVKDVGGIRCKSLQDS